MHSVALSSPKGKDTWDVHRSVELLGYHVQERRVEILLILLAENKLLNNELRILHRGRVASVPLPAWPLPHHPDERELGRGVLHSIYGDMFKQTTDGLWWVGNLSSCDTLECLDRRIPLAADHLDDGLGLTLSEPERALDPRRPFTAWTLSCPKMGHHLLAFRLSFEGETYEKLVTGVSPVFTVDGAERLVARIEHEDAAFLPTPDRHYWLDRLRTFQDPAQRIGCINHDVILIGAPGADQVVPARGYSGSGIYRAPRQPSDRQAARYSTADAMFTLPLCFASRRSGRVGAPLPAFANRSDDSRPELPGARNERRASADVRTPSR